MVATMTVEEFPSKMSFMTARQPFEAKPFYRGAPDPGFEQQNFTHSEHDVVVRNARPQKDSFSLDANGFAFCSDAESATDELLSALRAGDKELVQRVYYPHIERIVKRQTGASKVFIFDHTVRRRVKALAGKNPDGREQPASTVRIRTHVGRCPFFEMHNSCLSKGGLLGTLRPVSSTQTPSP
jgi:hypothetical protein